MLLIPPLRVFTITTLIVLALGVSRASAFDAAACARLTTLSIPDTTIVSATMVPASSRLPEYCNVRGRIDGEINFELRLPTNWNGKFYHQGTGGFAGSIPAAGPRTRSRLRGGRDRHGTSGQRRRWIVGAGARRSSGELRLSRDSTSSPSQPSASSNLRTAKAAGALVLRRVLERRPSGADGGATVSDDFDGISAGAPALDWTGTLLGFNWDQQAIKVGADSSREADRHRQAVVSQCDAADGLVDGLVDSPRAVQVRSEEACVLGFGFARLSHEAQVVAYQKILSGPKNSKGESLNPGFPPGAEDGGSGWQAWISGPGQPVPPANGAPAQFMFEDQFLRFFLFSNPRYDSMTFNFDSDVASGARHRRDALGDQSRSASVQGSRREVDRVAWLVRSRAHRRPQRAVLQRCDAHAGRQGERRFVSAIVSRARACITAPAVPD
jgi:feruloyl esterase